jgi:hypothetical protein
MTRCADDLGAARLDEMFVIRRSRVIEPRSGEVIPS